MKQYKTIFIFLLTVFSLTGFISSLDAAGKKTDLSFTGKNFSANLNNVTIAETFEQIKKSKGIWISGEESLLKEKVSAHFENLPFVDGLRRILQTMNSVLIFDKNGEVQGVMLVSKKDTKGTGDGTGKGLELYKEIQQKTPLGGSAEINVEDMPGLKVTKNVEPPGGPVTISEEEKKHIQVIQNCPTPGGPVQTDPEVMKHFQVIQNMAPPGGGATMENKGDSKVLDLNALQKSAGPPQGMEPKK